MNEAKPASTSSGMRLEAARERIDVFSEFGLPHLYFAQHAAFPMSLTVDLLYRLWANFQRDVHGKKLHIPWIAVSDLLLSSLCDEVGHELYEMDVTVRAELLRGLQADPRFGQLRIHELSYFLLDYVQQQLHSNKASERTFAEAQQWTVLAYIQPGRAARELAESLKALEQNNKIEQIRLVSLMETLNTLAPPLSALEVFTPLLTYARGVERVARGDREGAKAQFDAVKGFEQIEQTVGVQLPKYDALLEPRQENASPQQVSGTPTTSETPATRKDFLISYHSADTDWANWIAWQLEEAGYTIELQAWAFQPEANFVAEVDKVEQLAKHIIAILSPDYLSALASMPAWVDAFLRDPRNGPDFIVALHVRECRVTLTSILGSVDYTNFVGLDEETARKTLLDRMSRLPDAPSLPSGMSYHSLTVQPHFPGTPTVTTKAPVKVLCSYSHKDARFQQELGEHLSVLQRRGLIDLWYSMASESDQTTNLAAEWKRYFETSFNTFQVILLLISPDFLASDYTYEVGMKRALERYEAGEALVIPILLSPCLWKTTPLASLRVLPENGVPISEWTNREKAFIDVAEGIRQAIEQFTGRSVVETEVSQGTGVQQTEEGDAQTNKGIAGATLLWVDDHPENNIYESREMEALGIQITLSLSTEDALEKVRERSYDVIISDMGRQPLAPKTSYDHRAGYNLLDRLRNQHILTPFIIYAGSSSAEDRAETRRHGGFGTTNNPEELFQMVIDAIEQSVNPSVAKAETVVEGVEEIVPEGSVEAKSGRVFSEVTDGILEAKEEAIDTSAADYDLVAVFADEKRANAAVASLNKNGFNQAEIFSLEEEKLFGKGKGMVVALRLFDSDNIPRRSRARAILLSNGGKISRGRDLPRWKEMGDTHANAGRYQEALEDYNRALEIDPRYVAIYNSRGMMYYQLGQYQRALADYSRAIELDPDNAAAYSNRGLTYLQLGNYQQALVDYDRAIELNPEFAVAYVGRGRIYSILEDYERAIYAYQKALHIYTQEAFPLQWANLQANLGDIYSTRTDGNRQTNLETAISYYQAALQVYTHAAFPNQWAELQRKLGEASRIHAQRRLLTANLNQLIETVKSQMQPSPRAIATASTLQQLSSLMPEEVTLADLVVGWQTLSQSSEKEEEPAIAQRRATCGELANMASQFTTDQGNLAQAIKAWQYWLEGFEKSGDPRQAAMARTFARELKELESKELL